MTMSKPAAPKPVKLIVSLITRDTSVFAAVAGKLSQAYGGMDFVSKYIPFDKTDYYEMEMGKHLMRRLMTFEPLMAPDGLPEVKHATDRLEAEYEDEKGHRTVNLDPGYIALSHLILATNKQFYHRPYLRDGVYADPTLVYKRKSFQSLEWTFPDYGSDEIIEIMNRLRERYRVQLRGM